MEESILLSIKKLLDVNEETFFNDNVAMGINTIFVELNQLGVGPSTPYRITDSVSTWADFMEGKTDIDSVKSYIFMSVKLMFDPPSTSYGISSMERLIEKVGYRLNVQVEFMREEIV